MQINHLTFCDQLTNVSMSARKHVERAFTDKDYQVPKTLKKEVEEYLKKLQRLTDLGVKVKFEYFSN